MNTTEDLKSKGAGKRLIGQIVFVAILLLIARVLWVRTQPELLADTAGTADSDIISGDYLYRLQNNVTGSPFPTEATIYAVSLHRGRAHKVSREDARWQVVGTQFGPNPLSIADGELFYGIEPATGTYDLHLGIPFSGMTIHGLNYLGAFLMAAQNPSTGEAAGQKRAVSAYPARPKEVRFRRVPLQGGQAQDAATLRGEEFCLVGSSVFWIRPKPETRGDVTPEPGAQSRNFWTEVTANSDLMLTSLRDNTTRCIRSGVPHNIDFTVGPSGVLWREPAPFPNPPNLFYARVTDGVVYALGSVPLDQQPRSVLEVGDRCYWTALIPETPMGPASAMALMSAGLDGSDHRVVLSQVENRSLLYVLPYVYRGSLYCLYRSANAPGQKQEAPASRGILCRLHPDRSNPIEVLRTLPKGISGLRFDDAYLYCTKNEKHRGLWETVTNDNVNDTDTSTLCRFPLE